MSDDDKDEAQRKQAEQWRGQIDELSRGEQPKARPKSIREVTEEAAEKAREKASHTPKNDDPNCGGSR